VNKKRKRLSNKMNGKIKLEDKQIDALLRIYGDRINVIM